MAIEDFNKMNLKDFLIHLEDKNMNLFKFLTINEEMTLRRFIEELI